MSINVLPSHYSPSKAFETKEIQNVHVGFYMNKPYTGLTDKQTKFNKTERNTTGNRITM